MDARIIEAFQQQVRSPLITRTHTDYEVARRVWNGMIDRRPLLIAQPESTSEVAAAVSFAHEHGLPLSVKGGGHGVAGPAICEDGLVIDLVRMQAAHVDPTARTATVQGGARLRALDAASQAHGLATTAGIYRETGVAGLMLGGGLGLLMRRYGLTCDNLLAAEVVTADGQVLETSEQEHPDLFWALRGGGGNFGVVTSFVFRTNPAKLLYGGPIVYDIDDAAEIMRWYRDFEKGAPLDFYIFLGLQAVPPTDPFPPEHWNKKMCVLLVAHNGENGEAAVNAIRAELPTPLFDWCGPIPYTALQSLFDPFYPKGQNWYWKGDFVKTLPDAAIEAHVAHARMGNVFSAMHLYPIDGAVHRKQPGETAWATRDATWSMVIVGLSPEAMDIPTIKDWAKGYWSAVHPHNLAGAYPNFMMDDEGEGRVRAAFGDNYPRLAAVKSKYDPANLFKVNQNILPHA